LLIIHGGLNQDDNSFDDMWVLVGLSRKVDKLQAEMSHLQWRAQESI